MNDLHLYKQLFYRQSKNETQSIPAQVSFQSPHLNKSQLLDSFLFNDTQKTVDNYVNYSDGENSSEQLFFLRLVEIICSCIAFTLDFQK